MGVIDRLKNHILVDGFHVVVDTEKSHGSWVVDKETGKEYLDCYSQFASQALGWNHEILKAHEKELGQAALHKLANSDMYSEVYAQFVESISEATPDHKHYFFIDGGALAIENALKAAFDWKYRTAKDKRPLGPDGCNMDVIHFQQAFHGRSGYTMSLTNSGHDRPNNNNIKTMYYPKFNWTRVTNPKIHFPMCPEKVHNLEVMAIQQIEAALATKRVAAIIIEPIQGEGGDNHFRYEFLKELRRLADENECLLIFDEVQTGVCITGHTWAYEHFQVVPDILVFGKKTQVCGFCATDRIDSVENVFNTTGRINSTWGGNIVDMARASLIFHEIKRNCLNANSWSVGGHIHQSLLELESSKLSNIRGRGMFIAFDLEDTAARDQMIAKLSEKMLVLKSGTKSIRLRPHLTMTKDEGSLVVENIKAAC